MLCDVLQQFDLQLVDVFVDEVLLERGERQEARPIEIVDEEAYWVRQIFEWYNNRVPALDIRRRLIAANASQNGSQTPRRIHWARSSIQMIEIAN